jgi:YD repeat-containing protein
VAPQGGVYGSFNNPTLPTLDFNGDGQEDLLLRVTEGSSASPQSIGYYYDIYLSSGDDFGPAIYGTTRLDNLDHHWSNDIRISDINGDGLSDLIFQRWYNAAPADWVPMISDGNRLIKGQNFDVTGVNAIVDFDGDSRGDLLVKSGGEWRIYRSDNVGYGSTFDVISLPFSSGSIDVVDFTGDGYADLLSRSSGEGVIYPGLKGDLLVNVVDGLGNSNQMNYGALLSSPHYQSRGLEPTSGAHYIVESVRSNDGRGGSFDLSYDYTRGRRDAQRRWDLSFNTINVTDSRSGIEVRTTYSQWYPFIGRVSRQKTSASGAMLRESVKVWGSNVRSAPYDPYGSSFVFVRLDQSDDKIFEPDDENIYVHKKKEWLWNVTHGVPHRESTWDLDNTRPTISEGVQTVSQVMSFDDALISLWCLGRPTRTDITMTSPEAIPNSDTRSSRTTFDSGKCYLATQTVGSLTNPAKQVKTVIVRDPFGRLQSTTQGDGFLSASTARAMMLNYPNHWTAHPNSEAKKIISQDDPVVTREWNDALGFKKMQVNAQGMTTAWTYDAFGRMTREDQTTLGTWTTASYVPCSGWCPPHTRYTVKRTLSNGAWVNNHYDQYGRMRGRAMPVIGGESRTILTYSVEGYLASETVPYLAGQPSHKTRYDYDLLGRRTKASQPMDETDTQFQSVTSWNYNGVETAVINAEQQTTTYAFRPDGALASVNDAKNGVTNYRHTPFGQLSRVQDPDDTGFTTSLGYDELGRLGSRVDRDTGNWVYDFNTLGEPVYQQDDLKKTVQIK